MPSMVGSRGSSYHGIFCSSISGRSTLFETGMPSNSSLENSRTRGFLMPRSSSMA